MRSVRSPITTCAPRRSKACAVANPMPRAAPVLTTIDPSNERLAFATWLNDLGRVGIAAS
jgi:hypothetical protein